MANRPGSGSLVGTMAVLNAPADGYTLLIGGLTNIIFNGSMYKKRPYDPMKDFIPIGIVSQTPYVMVSRGDMTERDLTSTLRNARANPGKLNFANAGAGTGQQVLASALAKETGANFVPVPYQSAQRFIPTCWVDASTCSSTRCRRRGALSTPNRSIRCL